MRHIGTVLFLFILVSALEVLSVIAILALILSAGYILFELLRLFIPPAQNHPVSAKRPTVSGLIATTPHPELEQCDIQPSQSGKRPKSEKLKIIADVKSNGGLIIDMKWLELILDGQKTWEMRANRYKKQGYIALIGKGTKSILGIAHIDGYSKTLTLDELDSAENKHRIPKAIYQSKDYKWFVAMKLSKVVKFEQPVKYKPNRGAVIWVKLGEQSGVIREIEKHLDTGPKVSSSNSSRGKSSGVFDIDESKKWLKELIKKKPILQDAKGKIPRSRDGVTFTEKSGFKDGLIHLKYNGREYRFESYPKALSALRRQRNLQWRCFGGKKKGWVKASHWVDRATCF